MEGLDAWCYDAIARQAWTDGSDFVTLLRTAELVWTTFNANPAYFCSQVTAIQPIEDFLATGAPCQAADRVVANIQAYLHATRTAGSSTYLAISFDLEGPLDCRLTGVDLLAPGCSRLDVAVPGPESAGGLYDWPLLGPRHEARRMLVPPGPGVVPVAVTVRGPQPEGGYQDVRVEHAWQLVVAPHIATAVHLTVDASAWPKLAIVGRPGPRDAP